MNFCTHITLTFTLLSLSLNTGCMTELMSDDFPTKGKTKNGHTLVESDHVDGQPEETKTEPQTEPCLHEPCTPRHPQDCLEILENNIEALDGTYTIDPDGRGAIEIRCDMNNGGWTSLNAEYLSSLGKTGRRYLFTKNNTWIVTPSTTKVWNWESPQMLPGDYFYGKSGSDAEGFVACDVPALAAPYASYGVGCFLIPTDGWKVFPQGGYDDQTGAIGLCQNAPPVFGDDNCGDNVQVWERRDI